MSSFVSRRFVLAVIAIVVQILSVVIPELRPYADKIIIGVSVIFGIAVLGLTLTDLKSLKNDQPVTVGEAIKEIKDQLADHLLLGVNENIREQLKDLGDLLIEQMGLNKEYLPGQEPIQSNTTPQDKIPG